jgi:hypothetical protein
VKGALVRRDELLARWFPGGQSRAIIQGLKTED